MYQGNMQDFVDKLKDYLRKNNLGQLNGINPPNRAFESSYISYYRPSSLIGDIFYVEDTKDFEDKLLKFVKDNMRK